MRRLLSKIVLPLSVLALCVSAHADTRILEIWTCEVKEGHTLDEVKAVNAKWLEFVNRNIAGGDIQSYVVTPVVSVQGGFMFADSFPSMTAWSATKDALLKDEGQAIEDAFDELLTCESNNLYRSEQS